MQAQAAGAKSGGGDAPQGFLQNPKVQIGIIAVGVVAIIVLVVVLFVLPSLNSGGGTPIPVANANVPAGDVASSATPPAGPGGGGMKPTVAGPATASTAPAPGAPPSKDGAKAAAGPGVPTRKNPFEPNKDLAQTIKSIPPPPSAPEFAPPALDVYSETRVVTKKAVAGADEDQPGPPIPPMRVAGIVTGNIVTATLQIGADTFIQVRPGELIPPQNPVYRVERIEQDKVVLTRRWEIGEQHGVQRIEVGLQASAGSGSTPGGGFGGGRMGGMRGNGPSVGGVGAAPK